MEPRCIHVATFTLRRLPEPMKVRCDRTQDHLDAHAVLHDGTVLLSWGMDDDGIGVLNGGVMAPLLLDSD